MDCLMPRENLSLAARRGSFRRRLALSIVYGSWLVSREDAKTRRKTRGRSFVSTRRSVPCAIRCVDSLGESSVRAHREKVEWIPKRDSQMALGSQWLRAFAASSEPGRGWYDVARSHEGKNSSIWAFSSRRWNSRHPDRVARCRSRDGIFCDAGIRLHMSCGRLRWQGRFADQGPD
jgi:hypothetical protein